MRVGRLEFGVQKEEVGSQQGHATSCWQWAEFVGILRYIYTCVISKLDWVENGRRAEGGLVVPWRVLTRRRAKFWEMTKASLKLCTPVGQLTAAQRIALGEIRNFTRKIQDFSVMRLPRGNRRDGWKCFHTLWVKSFRCFNILHLQWDKWLQMHFFHHTKSIQTLDKVKIIPLTLIYLLISF